MELFSAKFKQSAKKALDSQKIVLAVVHQKAEDRLVLEAKNREDAEVFAVTAENRAGLAEMLTEKVVTYLAEH